MYQIIKSCSIAVYFCEKSCLEFCRFILEKRYSVTVFDEVPDFLENTFCNCAVIDLKAAVHLARDNCWELLLSRFPCIGVVAPDLSREQFKLFYPEKNVFRLNIPFALDDVEAFANLPPQKNSTIFSRANNFSGGTMSDTVAESISDSTYMAVSGSGNTASGSNGTISATEEIIGVSDAVQKIKSTLNKIADTECRLLFLGESGTGKSLAARTVHRLSSRRQNPFIEVNMAVIPPDLSESALFGSVKGAFTDAIDRPGFFGAAGAGTIFLDEIAELPFDVQGKLLRVIERGLYRRVGEDKERKSEARILLATNANLIEMVHQKKFRDDLYWRIAGFPIEFPPLRSRREDIIVLAEHFLKKEEIKFKIAFRLTKEASVLLEKSDWPGNIRQLESTISRACLLSRETGVITPELVLE